MYVRETKKYNSFSLGTRLPMSKVLSRFVYTYVNYARSFEIYYVHTFLDNFTSIMQSLSVYARLFARAISGTEAENILFNSLLRLSSTSVHITQSPTRLAITHTSSAAIRRTVHLVTASSGYSSHDNDEEECITKTIQNSSSKEQRTNQTNVYGDDAFFITKHRIGDFLGKSCISRCLL